MEKQENLSQSKYAEHRNVTKGYIGRMVKEGRLHLIKGKLNVEMSDAELDSLKVIQLCGMKLPRSDRRLRNFIRSHKQWIMKLQI